ncbi:MAG: Mov34/MPN/PAD-1 family protein [Candidatus Bathyarchaeota archaeon]|nr:Mov34/MPN/PAD-1 family protein [Candidatus Bathyarchaeota archaeon]MDH5495626.1 Mov34/MPN/PAD-1 family protein [Candidatus Bathyarchaeota archaeon]
MFENKKSEKKRKEVVQIKYSIFNSILESARTAYPRETILLLRGKIRKDRIEITDLVIPPLATHGKGFSSFPPYMLPIDFSLIGTVHSHPSSVSKPSMEDLNHSFGRIMMIVAYPFVGKENVAVYNRSGEKIVLQLTE